MNRKLVHLVMHFYPRSWRDRYGEEFEAILMDERNSIRTLLNAAGAGLRERLFPTLACEEWRSISFGAIVRQPSAVVPMAMSIVAIGIVQVHIALAGFARQADEGAAAHSWQLLMAGQIPLLLFFAIKWLPRTPRQAFRVLALQAAAMAAAMMPVFLLKW